MRHPLRATVASGVLLIMGAGTFADDFVGKFHDDKISVEIAGDPSMYLGTITLGAQRFPLSGKAQDGKLAGSFSSSGANFAFTAINNAGKLAFTTGGKTYLLDRDGAAAANPVAATATPSPVPAAAPTGAAQAPNPNDKKIPPGYTVVRSTAAGVAMVASKPKVATVKAALDGALNDLDDYFDDDYDYYDGVEDQRDHRSGMCGLKAKFKGQAVKGTVVAHLTDKSSIVIVVVCKADATSADWAALTAAAPPAGPQGRISPDAPPPPGVRPDGGPGLANAPADRQADAPPQQVALTEYRFPDGTATIGMAEGYHIDNQGPPGTIVGPSGQRIGIGTSFVVNTPDSSAVQMARQYPVPANRTMLVAPVAEPADAIRELSPQLSRVSQGMGKPGFEVDHVTKLQDLQPMVQGNHDAMVRYGMTQVVGNQQQHFQVLARVSVAVVGNGAWSVYMTACMAPDATVKQDMPVMLAMLGSLKMNDAVINANTAASIAQSTANFNQEQQANRELQATYHSYNEAQATNSVIRSRSFDDFDEGIRGYRTVEDTRTGEQQSVNLGEVDKFVDDANKYDPGRLKQIPLRDEADPLPGH